MDENALKALAVDYLAARHKFLQATDKVELFHGNDNIVGRIGEFVAMLFLKRQGRTVSKATSKVQKGFDLLVDQKVEISVKVITAENNLGRTTRVKKPWSELILVTLNAHYEVDRIGHITAIEMAAAVSQGFLKSEEPYANRNMVKDGGLFERFGRLYKDAEVEGYL
jgi:hypothetical protein